jgi:hypothetical protein
MIYQFRCARKSNQLHGLSNDRFQKTNAPPDVPIGWRVVSSHTLVEPPSAGLCNERAASSARTRSD